MSIRYYLSPYVNVPGPGGHPHRIAKAGTYPLKAYSAVVDISGLKSWCLCAIEAVDHAPIVADAEIVALPDVILDTTIGSLSAGQRNGLSNALSRFGIDVAFTNADTVRALLQRIGVLNVSSFNIDKLTGAVY